MNENPVVLFDGVCNLCNGSVQFIIRRDRHARFRFAALQSNFGIEQMKQHSFTPGMMNSVILIKGDKAYIKSNAVLEIAFELGGLWKILYVFKIIPAFLRNWIYDLVAKNRYRLFGRRDECMIPTPELRSRFIV